MQAYTIGNSHHTSWTVTSRDSKFALHYLQNINAPLFPHVKFIITSILIHMQKDASNCNNKHYFRQLILLPSIAAPD